ncbi:hypothetical protein BS47DRAFT_260829 [Hydnum rufescens UP504]|uniref:HORMA domain-containing protein n=1 Tax=Hydnum rufescens UP504 TaxID=1448309 RepID=A0A9P6E122_9AGAM|nr:hypothetical protein BS47DRAFT_260829 [Hydnum rufescens UP504]
MSKTVAATTFGLSYRDTAKAITSFLEVAVHTILRTRQVYPADLFVRRKKYDAPVYQSRHPALNEYIAGAIKAAGEELLGVVDKMVVVIKDQLDRPLERFVFSFQHVVNVGPEDIDKALENAFTAETLSQYFRAFLIKLSVMDSQLGEFSETDNLSFAIVLECKDGFAPSTTFDDEPIPWVPASKQHVSNEQTPSAQLHIVKVVETGVINMALGVQESDEKLKKRGVPHVPDDVVPQDVKGKGKATIQ